MQSSGEFRREKAGACQSTVIASEARQSEATHATLDASPLTSLQ